MVADYLETPKPLAFSPELVADELDSSAPDGLTILDLFYNDGVLWGLFNGERGYQLSRIVLGGGKVRLWGEMWECSGVFKRQRVAGRCPRGFIGRC